MITIDYERWQQALAMTESHANPQAWGDEGLACGKWQQHPAFVWEWGPDDVGVDWSWDQVFEAALKAFFDSESVKAHTPTELAMWFHLHGNAGAGWDAPYAQRFQDEWNKLSRT